MYFPALPGRGAPSARTIPSPAEANQPLNNRTADIVRENDNFNIDLRFINKPPVRYILNEILLPLTKIRTKRPPRRLASWRPDGHSPF
ncbi:hypothetical protein D3C79_945430 [compost metagenome]